MVVVFAGHGRRGKKTSTSLYVDDRHNWTTLHSTHNYTQQPTTTAAAAFLLLLAHSRGNRERGKVHRAQAPDREVQFSSFYHKVRSGTIGGCGLDWRINRSFKDKVKRITKRPQTRKWLWKTGIDREKNSWASRGKSEETQRATKRAKNK